MRPAPAMPDSTEHDQAATLYQDGSSGRGRRTRRRLGTPVGVRRRDRTARPPLITPAAEWESGAGTSSPSVEEVARRVSWPGIRQISRRGRVSPPAAFDHPQWTSREWLPRPRKCAHGNGNHPRPGHPTRPCAGRTEHRRGCPLGNSTTEPWAIVSPARGAGRAVASPCGSSVARAGSGAQGPIAVRSDRAAWPRARRHAAG